MSVLRARTVRVVFDVVLLVGFAAEFLTREGPDYALHSWIGIVLVPVIAVHLAANWRWVVSAVRRRAAHPEWRLACFNGVFSVMTAVCIVTGFPIWLDWSSASGWVTAHTVTGLAAVVMALVHLWLNRRRLWALAKPRSARA